MIGSPIVLSPTQSDELAPLMFGPSGSAGDSVSSVSIKENSMSVTTFTANENVNWSLFGGVDQGVFRIDHSSVALSFDRASDYESP